MLHCLHSVRNMFAQPFQKVVFRPGGAPPANQVRSRPTMVVFCVHSKLVSSRLVSSAWLRSGSLTEKHKKHSSRESDMTGAIRSRDQTESAAILKIKESMQEEAKRFEKESDHPDYFMQ
ncbi:Single-stranded DNA-binding protein 2 [Homalodisca vitripennis]|nr:Single-stranded DNA-binding protein 2 [Homalodisca vitripennis]